MSYALPKEKTIFYAPEALLRFHAYTFEWIDDLNFIRDPAHFLGERAPPYVALACERFRAMGWEGDGEVGLLWLPTFVFPQCLDMHPEGVVVWHVKQDTLGTSFLLSPVELPFGELVVR